MKCGTRLVGVLCLFIGCVALALPPALAVEGSRVKAGAEIYAQRCAPCHGEELNNVSGGWSFDLRRLRPDEHDRFVDSVTTGKDNMPSGTAFSIARPLKRSGLISVPRSTNSEPLAPSPLAGRVGRRRGVSDHSQAGSFHVIRELAGMARRGCTRLRAVAISAIDIRKAVAR